MLRYCTGVRSSLIALAVVMAGAGHAADLHAVRQALGVRVDATSRPDIVVAHLDGRPPAVIPPDAASVPIDARTTVRKIAKVPSFTWCYGCVPSAGAMLMGYYDNVGYPFMYAGPANNGLCPMNNERFWPDTFNNPNFGESPLAASHLGYDNRTIRGHVEDHWVGSDSAAEDPWLVNGWPLHSITPCVADYMWSSRSDKDNKDGETKMFISASGQPAVDYDWSEPAMRDGAHGLRLFMNARGYQAEVVYNQLIEQAPGFGNPTGFTWDDYKAFINAGVPVIVMAGTHSFLGMGYAESGSTSTRDTVKTMYIHTTWDNGEHTMTWGGSYGGQRHWAMSVVAPAAPGAEAMPDVAILAPGDTAPTGNGTYGDAPQQSVSRPVKPGEVMTYQVKVQNDASFDDTFTVSGGGGDDNFRVTYLGPAPSTGLSASALTNITTAMTGSGVQYQIAAGRSLTITLKVQPKRGTANGTILATTVTSRSHANGSRADSVMAFTKCYSTGTDPTIVPGEPGLTATRAAGSTTAHLTIRRSPDDPYGCRQYVLYRKRLAPTVGVVEQIGTIAATGEASYATTNTVLAAPAVYRFSVQATNGNKQSALVETYLNDPAITPAKPGVSAQRLAADTSTAQVIITPSPDDPNGCTHYVLSRRCTNPAQEWQAVATLPVRAASRYVYTDSGLGRDKPYNYQVFAYNNALASPAATGKLQNAPVDPSVTPRAPGLTANRNASIGMTNGRVIVTKSADDPTGCTHYVLYRQQLNPPNAPLAPVVIQQIGATGAPTYVYLDSGLSESLDYRYLVRAFNGTKVSDWELATLTDPAVTPRPPTLGLANYPGSGGTVVEVTIYKSPDDPRGCTGYKLYRRDADPVTDWVNIANGYSDGSTSYGYEDGGLTPGKTYRYMLMAVNGPKVSAQVAGNFTPTASAASSLVASAVAQATVQGAQVTLTLSADATVGIQILNLAGRVVATLPEAALSAGTQTVLWNRRGQAGTRAPAGSYLVRCTARTVEGTQAQALTSLQLR